MCGIVGYFVFPEPRNECKTITEMSREIYHRGPDDEGFAFIAPPSKQFLELASRDTHEVVREWQGVIEPKTFDFPHQVAMAHRRFSIIDLSHTGHQPMWDPTQSYCVVFNGEIFNYIELRAELEQMGVNFSTQSDTEVMLSAYDKWGMEAFKKFSGFWAIALYDLRKNRLILSRDRIGKKPLYIYRDKGKIVWASEIKSLLRFLDPSSLTVDDDACCHYLYYGRKDIGHRTFWKEIKMMDQAVSKIITADGNVKDVPYWEIPQERRNEKEVSIKTAQKELRDVLSLSLSERLRADVPIAFELSGGMDSSSLVALRATLRKDDFSVFTIKYPEKGSDESYYAVKLAEQFSNIRHHIIEVDFADIDLWEPMNEFAYLMEEPFHSPNLLVSNMLRSNMREQGYKVLISGGGGDETLVGYTEYAVPIVRQLMERGQYFEAARNVLFFKEKYPFGLKPMTRIFLNRLRKQDPQRIFYDKYLQLDMENTPGPQMSKEIDALLAENMRDLRMYYWMSAGDKLTMGIPLESRAPFLDHRVVEYVFSLPVSYLMRNGWLKWLLRKSLQDILPREVGWRKEKMGFPFPIETWLRESQHIIKGFLKDNDNRWVDNRAVLADFDLIVQEDPTFLWRIFNFQLWHTMFIHREKIDYKKYLPK